MSEQSLPHHHHDEKVQRRIVSDMPDNETIAAVSEALKQLGDPSRLRIFWLLCHTEECVLDIAALVGMSSPAVSHHLRLLKAAGLLETRRVGKEVYYRAADSDLVRKLHTTIEEVARISCPD
ncbi:MAG: metalloregulator ArsR/SmtB family transcription factor [Sphaerochaetaceae bacterium]|nr:metalloregulator ArsR/SmtB family transcription factor [Sphaerochaetaceae bacterium]